MSSNWLIHGYFSSSSLIEKGEEIQNSRHSTDMFKSTIDRASPSTLIKEKFDQDRSFFLIVPTADVLMIHRVRLFNTNLSNDDRSSNKYLHNDEICRSSLQNFP